MQLFAEHIKARYYAADFVIKCKVNSFCQIGITGSNFKNSIFNNLKRFERSINSNCRNNDDDCHKNKGKNNHNSCGIACKGRYLFSIKHNSQRPLCSWYRSINAENLSILSLNPFCITYSDKGIRNNLFCNLFTIRTFVIHIQNRFFTYKSDFFAVSRTKKSCAKSVQFNIFKNLTDIFYRNYTNK